jgi:multicomponent Na+:H+ antiporter subunit E
MNPTSTSPVRTLLRIAFSLVLLMVVWLLWSGYLKPLLVVLGMVSCVIVLILSARMGNLEQEREWQRLLLRLPGYWLWLSKEVVVSNLAVARIILSPKINITPTLVTLDALPQEDLGQAILGNSISLTPGTLTLRIEDGKLRVHCLTRDGARDLLAGEMNRRVAALTRR